MSTPTRFTVFKDVTSYFGGWALLIYQVRFVEPAQVNESFLWIAVGLIGVPSLAQLWALRSGGSGSGTGGSPSPPESPPSGPSRSPSPSASGGES